MNLLNWLQLKKWQSQGWQEIDCDAYAGAYAQFGGSVITHPKFIKAISTQVKIPLSYFGLFDGDTLIGAVPVWHSCIAGHKRALKKAHQYERVDLGNMEIILPMAPQVSSVPLPFKGDYISSLHATQINSLRLQPETLSLLKNYSENEFTKKFQYNRNREKRLLEDAGGVVREVNEFSSKDIAKWYLELFELRWQKKPRAYKYLHEQLEVIKDFLTGKILFINEKPIAIQLLFFAHSPEWISFEFLNAGVDPEFNQFSPGSVLTFLNSQWASSYAQAQGKQLRYSFGRSDADYKALWCHQVPVFRI